MKKHRSERSKKLRALFIDLHCKELNGHNYPQDEVLKGLLEALDIDEDRGGSELVNTVLSLSESVDDLYHAAERLDVIENCVRQVREMIPEEAR